MNNHNHEQVCSVNSFTVYLNILLVIYLQRLMNRKSCIFKEKQATTGSERQRWCTMWLFSPLKISFTSAISLVGSAPTYGRPEFESQLEDLSQSCPLSLPLRFLSPLHCPIIKNLKKVLYQDEDCSSSTNSNLNFVVHIFSFSFQSMRHMWAVSCWFFHDVIQKLCFGSNWMHTNIAVKFLSRCFSFNFCTIFVFLLLKSTASTSSLLITVSVAWTLYSDVLFLEKGGICGFTLCMYADYKAALTHDTLLHGLWFSPNIRHPSAMAWGTPPLTFYSLGSLPLKTSSLHWQHSAAHDVSA